MLKCIETNQFSFHHTDQSNDAISIVKTVLDILTFLKFRSYEGLYLNIYLKKRNNLLSVCKYLHFSSQIRISINLIFQKLFVGPKKDIIKKTKI